MADIHPELGRIFDDADVDELFGPLHVAGHVPAPEGYSARRGFAGIDRRRFLDRSCRRCCTFGRGFRSGGGWFRLSSAEGEVVTNDCLSHIAGGDAAVTGQKNNR